jgi:hypothetical protein
MIYCEDPGADFRRDGPDPRRLAAGKDFATECGERGAGAHRAR